MTREVLARKLASLERYLDDLRPHRGVSAGELRDDPYRVERLLELVVQVAVDVVTHELAERRVTPDSYRDAFRQAGRAELIPDELAGRLADAAGLRNVLVHMYDDIDYEVVAPSVDRALDDFTSFLELYRDRLREREE